MLCDQPEVKKSKIAASKLQMHKSSLPDKKKRNSSRYNLIFGIHRSIGTRDNSLLRNRKWNFVAILSGSGDTCV
jgi:hypothetical protein